MAETDVRALLRAERAARRITHPHASYTNDGKLLCNLCEVPVKSEAQWQGHLHSSQHVLRSQRAQEVNDSGRTSAITNGAGKKRKADTLSPEPPANDGSRKIKEPGRKKAKGSVRFKDLDDNEDDIAGPQNGEEIHEEDQTSKARLKEPMQEGKASTNEQAQAVDDAEFLAFERDLAALEQSANQRTALEAAATISAAPMTAEQLASQSGDESSTQRGRRDAELEADREDAARLLEEEFEQMEGLEERVRKLREKREALRAAGNADNAVVGAGLKSALAGDQTANDELQAVDRDDDDDDEDYDDAWGFGGE